jgi:5-methylcytosine-specific restriction endonuclease McrA
MKSKRTKACEIPPAVREKVEERDGHCCIFCGSPYARGEAHYIGRGQGGLGVEENIITTCSFCHREMDNGMNTKRYRAIAEQYLKDHYPDWNVSDLVYKKGFEYE